MTKRVYNFDVARVKVASMKKGWLFEGIPRISKNSKQLLLNTIYSEIGSYCITVKKGFKWNEEPSESSIKEQKCKDWSFDCPNCLFKWIPKDRWQKKPSSYKCPQCSEPLRHSIEIITPFIHDWFKYSSEEELCFDRCTQFMCICKFRSDVVTLNRDVALLICKKVIFDELEIRPNKKIKL